MYSYVTRICFFHEPSSFHFLRNGELATFFKKKTSFPLSFQTVQFVTFFLESVEFTTFSFETVKLATFSFEAVKFATFFNLKVVKDIKFTFLFKTV